MKKGFANSKYTNKVQYFQGISRLFYKIAINDIDDDILAVVQ